VYLYDGRHQLRRATKTAASGIVQGSEDYWYDGNGSRVAILRRDGSGNKLELIVFDHELEVHYGATSVPTHVYSYLSTGTSVARVDRTGTQATTADLEFQFHGLADSMLAAIDADGTTTAGFNYTPFGELIETVDHAGQGGANVAGHRRRFNDKYSDEASSLSNYGARYYDRVNMQWTQRDPLCTGTPGLARDQPRLCELYTFDANNPMRYLDPDGRFALSDPVVIFGVFTGYADVVVLAYVDYKITKAEADFVSDYMNSTSIVPDLGDLFEKANTENTNGDPYRTPGVPAPAKPLKVNIPPPRPKVEGPPLTQPGPSEPRGIPLPSSPNTTYNPDDAPDLPTPPQAPTRPPPKAPDKKPTEKKPAEQRPKEKKSVKKQAKVVTDSQPTADSMDARAF
jgi:RHS repeat-associated protein